MNPEKSNSEQLNEAYLAFQENNKKWETGNKSAGTRARKNLMEIKKLCDAIRKEIQAAKK